jgi:hypothetical protein
MGLQAHGNKAETKAASEAAEKDLFSQLVFRRVAVLSFRDLFDRGFVFSLVSASRFAGS